MRTSAHVTLTFIVFVATSVLGACSESPSATSQPETTAETSTSERSPQSLPDETTSTTNADAPVTVEPTTVAADPGIVARLGDSGPTVEGIQQSLVGLGYSVGDSGIDGEFGPATEAALIEFQTDYKLDPSGVADALTMTKLLAVENGLEPCIRCSTAFSALAAVPRPPSIAPFCDWVAYGYSISEVVKNVTGPELTPEFVAAYVDAANLSVAQASRTVPEELSAYWPTLSRAQKISSEEIARAGYQIGAASSEIQRRIDAEIGQSTLDDAQFAINEYEARVCGLPINLSD